MIFCPPIPTFFYNFTILPPFTILPSCRVHCKNEQSIQFFYFKPPRGKTLQHASAMWYYLIPPILSYFYFKPPGGKTLPQPGGKVTTSQSNVVLPYSPHYILLYIVCTPP